MKDARKLRHGNRIGAREGRIGALAHHQIRFPQHGQAGEGSAIGDIGGCDPAEGLGEGAGGLRARDLGRQGGEQGGFAFVAAARFGLVVKRRSRHGWA